MQDAPRAHVLTGTTSVAGPRSESAQGVIAAQPPQSTWQAPAVPHGLYAAANRLVSTGGYGAPLLAGCTWATWVAQCSNLTAYGNGSSFNDNGCGTPNGCTFGSEFQCDELGQRYAHYAWGEPNTWYGYGGAGGSAADMWIAGPHLPIPLQQLPNGGGVPPARGDLLIFGPGWLGSYWDGSGHVAIVRGVGPNYVDVVEQNATPSGTDRFPLSGSTVIASGYTPVTGWLRMTMQTPVPLPAYNLAGNPQTMSARSGEIDIAWRGTDGRIWTLGYRNQRWAPGPTAISAPGATGDPTVVSASPSRLDAFWESTDGTLWHAGYQEGFFSTGVWSTPTPLGSAAPQSPPRAVASGSGNIDVFWKSSDGTMRTSRYSAGSFSAPVVMNSSAVAGSLDAVQTAPGIVDVFWRDLSGNLWFQRKASWGLGAPLALSFGGVLSDPAAVSAADGNDDVFFRGGTGQLWHVSLRAGVPGPPAAIGTQSIVGRPAPAQATSGKMTVVQRSVDGSLSASLATGSSSWVGPQLLGDGPVGSDPSAVAFASGPINVFWRGQGGDLWYSAACSGCGLPVPSPVLRPA